MDSVGHIAMVTLALAVTIVLQVLASRARWSVCGLILPTLILACTTWLLVVDLRQIRDGIALITTLTAFLHYALYNILTILFLCIYNYSKRNQLWKEKSHS